MPLAFPSRSHGTIAFGFFNIGIDMLLLDRLFFFADAFCRAVVDLAEAGHAAMDGWRIDRPERIGDLHGAIAGVDLTGFIGATYRRHPFPRDPAGFRQDPEGARSRAWASACIADFGTPVHIPLEADVATGDATVGGYRFDHQTLLALVAYVDRGGHPRWKNDTRPDYVLRMRTELASRPSWRPPDGVT